MDISKTIREINLLIKDRKSRPFPSEVTKRQIILYEAVVFLLMDAMKRKIHKEDVSK